MLFDHCATCQRCCHVDPGFPPLEVTLTREEKKGLGSVCIENSCEHLGDAGCTLGDAKPLSCKLYPLAFNPKTKAFFFDIDCPLMPMYESQLQDPASEASNHLRQMSEAVKGWRSEGSSGEAKSLHMHVAIKRLQSNHKHE